MGINVYFHPDGGIVPLTFTRIGDGAAAGRGRWSSILLFATHAWVLFLVHIMHLHQFQFAFGCACGAGSGGRILHRKVEGIGVAA